MKSSKKQQGIALVMVLWMLALLTIMATGYSQMMRTETMLTANLVHKSQATALAEAGINASIAELLKPSQERDWKTDGTRYEYELNNNLITVEIHAESEKIHLNTASSKHLYGLLESVSVIEEDILSLVEAILDWRRKDGLFNSLDELLLVKGFTYDLYRKIRPSLTIYSYAGSVFSITSEAKINNTLARVNAVITLRRNGQRLYSILYWNTASVVADNKNDEHS